MESNQWSAPHTLDKGVRGWLVSVSCFFTLGISSSIYYSYGLMLPHIENTFKPFMDSQTFLSLPGSLCVGLTFFGCFFSPLLVSRIGLQWTAVSGSVLSTIGMWIASYTIEKPTQLDVVLFPITYGIIVGIGLSLIFCPSMVILTHYFDKRLGLANAMAESGIYLCNTLLPFVLPKVMQNHGLRFTLKVASGLLFFTAPCALMFVERTRVQLNTEVETSGQSTLVSFLKNKPFLIWLIGLNIAIFGQYVTYVHLVSFSTHRFPNNDANILMSLICGCSVFGRIFIGWLSDNKRVNVILLQATSFVITAFLMAIYATGHSYFTMALSSCVFGTFTGAFYGLSLKIVVHLVEAEQVGEGVSLVLGSFSIPLILGPTFAGFLYDISGSYSVPFALAGLECLLGAFILLYVYKCLRKPSSERCEDENIQL